MSIIRSVGGICNSVREVLPRGCVVQLGFSFKISKKLTKTPFWFSLPIGVHFLSSERKGKGHEKKDKKVREGVERRQRKLIGEKGRGGDRTDQSIPNPRNSFSCDAAWNHFSFYLTNHVLPEPHDQAAKDQNYLWVWSPKITHTAFRPGKLATFSLYTCADFLHEPFICLSNNKNKTTTFSVI